jgi:hypothetical protein
MKTEQALPTPSKNTLLERYPPPWKARHEGPPAWLHQMYIVEAANKALIVEVKYGMGGLIQERDHARELARRIAAIGSVNTGRKR